MKFKRIAKDKKGKILQEGDVITYKRDDVIESVIEKIVRVSREEYPDMEVSEVITDWKGNVQSIRKNTLTHDLYRNCVLVHPSFLSGDSPKFQKLRQLSEKAFNRAGFRRRIDR